MIAEMCLALAIYHEARGEPVQARYAVAAVVMERVAKPRWPDDVCGVVEQPHQFSFLRPGARIEDVRVPSGSAWDNSVREARAVLAGNAPSEWMPVADHYHRIGILPAWAEHMKPVAISGNHIFYKEK